jgi:hypothetical protein
MQCPNCGYVFEGTPESCAQCGVPFIYPESENQVSENRESEYPVPENLIPENSVPENQVPEDQMAKQPDLPAEADLRIPDTDIAPDSLAAETFVTPQTAEVPTSPAPEQTYQAPNFPQPNFQPQNLQAASHSPANYQVPVAAYPPYQAAPTILPSGAQASMVIGIISLASIFTLSFCSLGLSSPLTLILSIIGAVLGHRANKTHKTSQATTGIVLNWIGVGVSVLIIIFVLFVIFIFITTGQGYYQYSPFDRYW